MDIRKRMTLKEGDIRDVTVYITILSYIRLSNNSFIHKPTHNMKKYYVEYCQSRINIVTNLNDLGPNFTSHL